LPALSRFLRHNEALMDGTSVDEVWYTLVQSMAEYGFDRVLYGVTHSRTGTFLGQSDDFLVLSNHPSDYLDAFIRTGAYVDAPMVKWAIDNVGVASWRHIQDRARAGDLSEAELRVIELNQRHGLIAGYSISFRNATVRTKGAIGLCAHKCSQDHVDSIWTSYGREIEMLCRLAHLKLTSLPSPAPSRPLTPRQREVLEWVGVGKTTQDIALLMGVTNATVEKHLRLAREALSVETTAQAVLKASVHNQIFLSGS